MKVKQKIKSDDEYVYRPINPQLYPEFADDGQYQYFRFWCTSNRIVYEKYFNGIRVSYCVLPERVDIFQFDPLVTYVEQQRGPNLCQPVLRQ